MSLSKIPAENAQTIRIELTSERRRRMADRPRTLSLSTAPTFVPTFVPIDAAYLFVLVCDYTGKEVV